MASAGPAVGAGPNNAPTVPMDTAANPTGSPYQGPDLNRGTIRPHDDDNSDLSDDNNEQWQQVDHGNVKKLRKENKNDKNVITQITIRLTENSMKTT